MNNNFYEQNQIMFLFWWFIFLIILPWDQEKIVVFNLVLFLYGIYYFLGNSITETFNQKKEIFFDVLNKDFKNKIKNIKLLISDFEVFKSVYSSFILNTVYNYLILLNNSFKNESKKFTFLSFIFLSNILTNLDNNMISLNLQKYFFVSREIIEGGTEI